MGRRVYNYLGRRVGKTVYNWSGSAWQVVASHKFIWTGWMLLMELDGLSNDAVVQTYTWGLDLAGLNGQVNSLESAGTIGGLLAVHQAQVGGGAGSGGLDGGDYVYTHDANGNVGQVINWSQDVTSPPSYGWDASRLAAHYEYAPFGGVLSQSGSYAAANPFRFSTKYWDDETGLGNWLYRYYSPTLGRWISRDPIGEAGDTNLYSYARNNAIGGFDALGHKSLAVDFSWLIPVVPHRCSDACVLTSTKKHDAAMCLLYNPGLEMDNFEAKYRRPLRLQFEKWLASNAPARKLQGKGVSCTGVCTYCGWIPYNPLGGISIYTMQLPCLSTVKHGPLEYRESLRQDPAWIAGAVLVYPRFVQRLPSGPASRAKAVMCWITKIWLTCDCPW